MEKESHLIYYARSNFYWPLSLSRPLRTTQEKKKGFFVVVSSGTSARSDYVEKKKSGHIIYYCLCRSCWRKDVYKGHQHSWRGSAGLPDHQSHPSIFDSERKTARTRIDMGGPLLHSIRAQLPAPAQHCQGRGRDPTEISRAAALLLPSRPFWTRKNNRADRGEITRTFHPRARAAAPPSFFQSSPVRD